jgi:hypothetical protein
VAHVQQKSLFITEAELNEALHWVTSQGTAIPDAVFKAISVVAKIHQELARAKTKASTLLSLFRQQLGVEPKSERGAISPAIDLPPKSKLTDEQHLAALKARRAKLLAEIRRYEDRLGKCRRKRQKRAAEKTGVPGSDHIDAAFKRSAEAVFTGNLAESYEEDAKLRVARVNNFENPKGLHSASDDRTRYEYGVTTKTIRLSVETVTDPRTGKSVTASTDEIGPPNSQATWTAIANTIIAVIGYAIPINRLALMLEKACPYFTSTRICSYIKMSAELFQPIYSCLGEEKLPECNVFQGDDTKTRVIEIEKALKNGGELQEPPVDSLIAKVSEVFGRVFNKKRGIGKKRSLNVSVVIGKSDVADPRSYIFFFRTHLGTFGDLLSKMLETRSPKKKALTIVSDLASTNFLSPAIYAKFSVTHAGCAAHARRPFWRHKKKDERLCYWMLSAFLVLEQIEDNIDELGRTRERILRYRHRYSRKVWSAMLKRCHSVVRGEKTYGHYWPKTSDLYIACNYIINHFSELTRYLDDPHLPSNNNLSERVLRWDKVMQDASKFRMTEAGRLHVDILRTIVHTCSAAEIELKDYLKFVFKNRDKIENKPSDYTPYAYALLQDKLRAKDPAPQPSMT